MKRHYFEFTPTAITIRRNSDGPSDPVVATLTPEQLMFLATGDVMGRLVALERRLDRLDELAQEPARRTGDASP